MNINSYDFFMQFRHNANMLNDVRIGFEAVAQKFNVTDLDFDKVDKIYTNSNTRAAFRIFVETVLLTGQKIAQEWVDEQKRSHEVRNQEYTHERRITRMKLWSDVASRTAGASNCIKVSSISDWANYALQEFDKQF